MSTYSLSRELDRGISGNLSREIEQLIASAATEALYYYRQTGDKLMARHFGRSWLMANALWEHGDGSFFREAVHRAKLSQEAERRLNKARRRRQ